MVMSRCRSRSHLPSMSDSLLEKRISYAIRYLQFDASTRDLTWLEAIESFNSNADFKLPELMVLIHPRFMKAMDLDTKLLLGGDFIPNVTNGQKCRSKEVWGYECPYINSKIHVDHSFPRSRGGATHPMNAMYLCDNHNLMKSSDVHMYPWENLELNLEWIDATLEKIRLTEKRKSGNYPDIPKLKKRLD